MSNDPDDKFFDVLAGRRAADDADTRRAARLRQYFEMHPSLEEQPRHDSQGEAQLIAYLRAQAAAAPKVVPSTPQPGLLTQLAQWLFPAQGSRALGYGMVAAAVLGAVVVLRLVQPADDDTGTMKSLPPGAAPASAPAAPPVIRAADPARAAAEVQTLLSNAGVPATLTPQGAEVLLSADVPPARQEALAQALAAQGLALPADGQLRLRFAPRP